MKLADLRNDPELETGGRWCAHPRGFKLRIARMNNPKYAAVMRRVLRDRPDLADADEIPRDVTNQALAEAIVTDWDVDDGPYSPQAMLPFLADAGYEWLRTWVVYESSLDEQYREKRVQAEVGK